MLNLRKSCAACVKFDMIPSLFGIPRAVVLVAFASSVYVLPSCGQIFIDDPPDLVKYIQGSTAAFGTPSYGEYILGQLFYGESDNSDRPHCTDDYKLQLPSDTRAHLKKIVVARRGGCHFAEKVLVAATSQDAEAVIIVDNDPLRSPTDIRMIIMAEDEGIQRKIHIPSILISHEEGEPLIQAILEGRQVYARLEWDIPNAKTVLIDHWNSPALTQSVKFLGEFARVARAFGEKLDFRPHFWVFPLAGDYNTMCSEATGKFCAISPEWGTNTTGRAVIEESVRQKCLWRESKAEQGDLFPRAYWDYVERFPSHCPATHPAGLDKRFFGEDCSFELMNIVAAPINAVKSCYSNDFEEILSEEKYTVAWSPTATMINNWRYSGPLTADSMVAAICTGFFEQPKECEQLLSAADAKRSSLSATSQGVPWWVYLLSVFGAILAMIATVFCYRAYLYKRLKNELRYEVFEEVKSRTKSSEGGPRKATSHTDRTSTGSGDASFSVGEHDLYHGQGYNEGRPVKAFDGIVNNNGTA